jgi:hypothetical protein
MFRSTIAAVREGHIGASEGGSICSSRLLGSPIPGTNKAIVSALLVPMPAAPVPVVYVMTFGAILKV